jgi:hypothetical protein
MEGEDTPAIRGQVMPYSVATSGKQKWATAQQALWRRGAIDEANPAQLATLLKQEILDVL